MGAPPIGETTQSTVANVRLLLFEIAGLGYLACAFLSQFLPLLPHAQNAGSPIIERQEYLLDVSSLDSVYVMRTPQRFR